MAGLGQGNPDVVNNPQTRQERKACTSCPQWDKCLFNQRKMGGFKGNDRYETNGRHNVGYQLLTDRAELSNAKEDFMSCETFTDVMLDRMLDGQALRLRGEEGEIVRISAQEGETITQQFRVGFNSRNQIIKPMPHLVEPLKASYNVNLDDQGQAVEFKDVTVKLPVPKYRIPNRRSSDYSESIARDLMAAHAADEDAEANAWSQARARKQAEEAAAKESAPEPEAVVEMPKPSGAMPQATPIKDVKK